MNPNFLVERRKQIIVPYILELLNHNVYHQCRKFDLQIFDIPRHIFSFSFGNNAESRSGGITDNFMRSNESIFKSLDNHIVTCAK